MRLLGVFGGIGSPAVNAYRAGHEVIGNIEPRSFAHVYDDYGRNTFLDNFTEAWLVKRIDEVPESEIKDVDVIFGHPKCGAYSNLINKTGQDRIDYAAQKSTEFLEFLRIVDLIRPKFAFFDNLPKSLEANPKSLYEEKLPDYDIFVEYVSNYYYGNSQFNRNRLFIIAAHKDLGYQFIPGEYHNDATLETTIDDLYARYDQLPNHDTHTLKGNSGRGKRVYQEEPMTWEQVKKTFEEKIDNKALHYYNEDGELKYHFGYMKAKYDKPTPTLIGTNPIIHPLTCLPLSIRERARIMGFPDDFIFYGTEFENDGTWSHNRNGNMIKQTGRCIPCEFPGFLIDQFDAFINDRPYICSGERLAKPNKYVEEACNEDLF